MPIRIKHRDKNISVVSGFCNPDTELLLFEVGSIGPEAMLFSKASYAAIDTVPAVLQG